MSTKVRVIEWLESQPQLAGVTREACARHIGVHPHTLKMHLAKEDVDFRFLLLTERNGRALRAETTEEAVLATGLCRDAVYRIRRGF